MELQAFLATGGLGHGPLSWPLQLAFAEYFLHWQFPSSFSWIWPLLMSSSVLGENSTFLCISFNSNFFPCCCCLSPFIASTGQCSQAGGAQGHAKQRVQWQFL